PSTAQIIATAHGSVGQFIGQSAGGTPAAESAVTTGTDLAWFGGRGYTGTGFSGARGAMIGRAREDWSPTANGAVITLETTPNGTQGRLERMRIDQNGNVGIGTITPTKAKVEISGWQPFTLGPFGFLNGAGQTGFNGAGGVAALSLYADLDVA